MIADFKQDFGALPLYLLYRFINNLNKITPDLR